MNIKEALNDGTLSLEDEIDYTDMTEEEYKQEIERLNNIINELEKDIKKLCTYGIKNNAQQRDYLLNRLEGLKEYKGSDK